MPEALRNQVESILASWLREQQFRFDEAIELDHGNWSAVIYASPDCKLYVYRSARDGEANCLLGLPAAKNNRQTVGEWFFLYSLTSEQQSPSIEELLARVPETPQTTEQQLVAIAEFLRTRFKELLRELGRRTGAA